jgi:hypothetical protein
MNAREINFAYKVRHALNENLDHLPSATVERLAAARKQAMAVRRSNPAPLHSFATLPAFAGRAGGFFGNAAPWLGRAGLVVPLVALVVGLGGIFSYEQQKHISDTADIDAAVLSDELPLSAYLDHGFSAYLARQAE